MAIFLSTDACLKTMLRRNVWRWHMFEVKREAVMATEAAVLPLTASPRWICSSYRQSHFVCSTACSLWGMVDGRFYGLASQRIRPQNGSQIRSRNPAAGNKLPAISFVIGTRPMVRSSSEGFDQWAFAIDRRRRAPLGKTDMLKG